MDSAIVVGVLSLLGTLVGTGGGILVSNKLTDFRLRSLEEKVNKHNNLIERMAVCERDVKTVFSRIDELKEDVRR